MNIKKMLERQQEIVNSAREEGRALTEEEQREFDELQGKINAARSEGGNEDPTQNQDDSVREQIEEERQRNADIVDLCRNFGDLGLDSAELIRTGKTSEQVREMIIEKQIKNGKPLGTKVTEDEGDKFRSAASDAMLMRAGLPIADKNKEREDAANPYRSMSLERLAVRSLEADGISTSMMSRDQLFSAVMERQYFNPSAAFPSIMDQTVKKAYEAGYNNAPATYHEWVTIGTLSDFKKSKGNYVAGAAGEFLEVPENGELKADLPKDHQRPERQLKTYGRQFTMSRQAFINDDIDFITTIPARYATSAQRTLNKQVYSVLYNNGKIYDGKALFCADHKNLITTGAKPTLASLKQLKLKLQKQTGLDDQAINIRPEYILTPADYEMDLRELIVAPSLSDENVTMRFNPFYGAGYKIVVDDTICNLAGDNPVPWHIVGNKADAKSIQVDFLNGQKIPTITRSTVPGTLGFVWDIYLDWGISVMDYRGVVRNPGVKL